MPTIWAFDNTEKKHTLYRGGYMKKFPSSLKEHATNVINFEKKKMLLLNKKELRLHHHAAACYICGKSFNKNKDYGKVRDHCHYTGTYRGATHSICNSRFKVPHEVIIVFHNESNYDYHFVRKELKSLKVSFNVLEKAQKSTKLFQLR